MYALVCPLNRSFDDSWISYIVPQTLEYIEPWYIVEVPYGKSLILALVLKITEQVPNIDISKIKSIEACPYEFPFMYTYQIDLLLFISQNYFSLLHQTLSLFLPKNLKEKIQKWKFVFKPEVCEYTFNSLAILSDEQKKVYTLLQNLTQKTQLLYWVTGSGKTNIYIELIHDILKQEKQSLLLVPEIILTSQTVATFEKIFWKWIVEIHSSISEAQKTKNWQKIYSWNAKIIIGTRSALFYPFKDLWCIIVDEEHDRSYISDSAPRYSAKTVAYKLWEYHNIPIIYASGTPSTTTMYAAINKKIWLVTLLEEYNNKK